MNKLSKYSNITNSQTQVLNQQQKIKNQQNFMRRNIVPIIFIFTLLSVFLIVNATQQVEKKVYTIHYMTSFLSSQIQSNFGCRHSVIYGYYQYPEGDLDMLHVINNPGQYALGVPSCQHKQSFISLFGSNQDYQRLVKDKPEVVASRVKNSLGRISIKNYIIQWNYLQKGQIPKIKAWLQKFISELPQAKVYIKAPASYFCYTEQNNQFILDIKNAKGYIIEIYGEDPKAYRTYSDIFEKESQETNNSQYPQTTCSKYPSLAMLSAHQGQFFLASTLQIQEPGYLGNTLEEYLQKGKAIYDKNIFYDSYPQNVFPL